VQGGCHLQRFVEPDVSRKVSSLLMEELGLRPDQVDSLQTIPYEILDAAARKAIQIVKQSQRPEQMTNFGLEWEPLHDGHFLPFQPDELQAIELSKNIPLFSRIL
jgi:para-nitrobenzyl esterase